MKSLSRYYRARAPLRISFCGGGTDVSPYPEQHGGCVLSATIDHYAYASLRPRRDSRVALASLDYDIVARHDHPKGLRFDGSLDLLKAAIRALRVKRGMDLWTHSDAPPGSGLGASSTLMVTLLAVLREWLKQELSPYEMAELALPPGRPGGGCDQYLCRQARHPVAGRGRAVAGHGAAPAGPGRGHAHHVRAACGRGLWRAQPHMQQWVARKLMNELGDPDEKYNVGDVVQFPTPDGQGSYAGAVLQVRDDGAVLFDFNHPLAGQPVTFEVQLIGIL